MNSALFTATRLLPQTLRGLVGVLCWATFMGGAAQAQTLTFRGETEGVVAPLPDVYVQFRCLDAPCAGQVSSLLTDAEGRIHNPFAALTVVLATYLGYETLIDTLLPNQTKTLILKGKGVVLNETVVTAQYGTGTVDQSVHRLKVIDRQRIDALAAVNLQQLLQFETNIRISQDPVLGSGLSMQGVGGQNVKILIDGVPLIGRLDGNIDLSQINLNNIERVELVEGPMSVNYGTDALGGVINLITRKDDKKKLTAAANFYYETVGKYNADARLGLNLKRNRINLSGGRNFFDGWSAQEVDRTRTWKPKEQYFANAAYERSFGQWRLGYDGSFFQETVINRGKPEVNVRKQTAFAFDDFYRTHRINNVINLNGVIEKSRYLDFIFAYSYFSRLKDTYRRNLVTLEDALAADPAMLDTTGFMAWQSRGTYSMNKADWKINYQLGYDFAYELGSGDRIDGYKQGIGGVALFGSAEYRPIQRLTLRPGIRWGYNNRFRLPVAPSLNVKYDITEKMALRLGYARGFRTPSIKELYIYFVDVNHNIRGNDSLKSESGHLFNLSLNYKHVRANWVFQFEPTAFYNYTRNLIQLAMVDAATQLYTNINIGSFQSTGGRISTKFRYKNLSIEAAGGFMGVLSKFGVPAEAVNSPKMLFTPEATLTVSYRYEKWGVGAASFYKFTGAAQGYYLTDERKPALSQMGAYHLWDLTVNKTFWAKRITLTVGARNLLNVTAINAVQAAGAHNAGGNTAQMGTGRSFFAGLGVQF